MTKVVKRKNKHKQRRILFIAIAFLVSITSLILIILNFKSNIVFFYSPSELNEANIMPNKVIRVGGLIKEGSITNNKEKGLIFTVTDLQSDLVIAFNGIKPDLFRSGQGMIAKGKFDKQNNIFIADELLAKHDENYMPPEVKNSLKKRIVK
jgi:cytochrome c-type biogenesis protein CcmE